MQSIIASLAARHGLSKAEVLREIESAFSTLFTKWYHVEVLVHIRKDLRLEAVAYNKVDGLILQKTLDLPTFFPRDTITQHLEHHLAKAAACKLARRYKSFEKHLLWGQIVGLDPEGNLYVETEIIPGEAITGICPLNRIGLHERYSEQLHLWQRRAFHLRRVEPVVMNGTPRTKIVLDRVSKTLTEELLRYHLGDGAERYEFRCVKRYVGHRSIILTTRKLPREAILAVDRELKERVEVQIVKQLP